jgi:hypothetical protein
MSTNFKNQGKLYHCTILKHFPPSEVTVPDALDHGVNNKGPEISRLSTFNTQLEDTE